MLALDPDMVWNSRLWSVPLSQPLPSASSMSGLLEYDICECAMVVSARASKRPLGLPSPLTRS